jgi:predicted transposase/invertase (TIGR01784 family)
LRYKSVEINAKKDYINERGKSMLAQSLDEWKEEGRLEGRLEEKIETAKNMLIEGLDIKMISHITGLSISEIEKL